MFRIKGESHTKSNVEKIGGTAGAGSILGAIFGGKGALIPATEKHRCVERCMEGVSAILGHGFFVEYAAQEPRR